VQALIKFAPGPGNVEIRDVLEPHPGPGQVKLRIDYCGVCGTDLHVLHDTFRNFPPVILGHEFTGTVVETGPAASAPAAAAPGSPAPGAPGVSEGDRVAVLGAVAVTCGECRYCQSGEFMFCPRRRGMGHGVSGAFTRYVLVRPDQCYRLPPGIGLDEGAVCEPFAAAVQAVCELTTLRLGDAALVSGPGPIGLLCLKLLVAAGVRTIVAGAAGDTQRLDLARRLGAARTVDTTSEGWLDLVREGTAGAGVDLAFECAGHPGSVRNCLEALRPLGQFTQVGICGREIGFRIDSVFYKQLQIRGSVGYTRATWRRMMKILEQGSVRLGDLISHRVPLAHWERAFALVEDRQAVKVLIEPGA
jgi:L-iditol 2-dehydrogenase